MKNSLAILTACLLTACPLFAQEKVSVKGRIVNERGEAVEYVQVGIPKIGLGAVASADGHFEINAPASDTLEFHHISYQTAFYPVAGHADDVVIVLQEQELPPAVFIGGDTKEKYLLRAGTKIPGGLGDFHRPDGVEGSELGSVARVRKPFLVKDILFSVRANYIPGCVAAINIYRIDGEPEAFVNILRKPIYVKIPLSDEQQDFNVQPEETILLEPGRYFISYSLVDCDKEAVQKIQDTPESERDPQAMHLYVFIHFKSSYQRFTPLSKLFYIPVNIGIAVKGLEYQ